MESVSSDAQPTRSRSGGASAERITTWLMDLPRNFAGNPHLGNAEVRPEPAARRYLRLKLGVAVLWSVDGRQSGAALKRPSAPWQKAGVQGGQPA